MIAPEDPLMAPVREQYVAAIAGATVDGALDNGGIRRAPHYAIFVALSSHPDPRQICGTP